MRASHAPLASKSDRVGWTACQYVVRDRLGTAEGSGALHVPARASCGAGCCCVRSGGARRGPGGLSAAVRTTRVATRGDSSGAADARIGHASWRESSCSPTATGVPPCCNRAQSRRSGSRSPSFRGSASTRLRLASPTRSSTGLSRSTGATWRSTGKSHAWFTAAG